MTLEEGQQHIGDWATYIPNHANGDIQHKDCQRGIITSVNTLFIFVRFKGPGGEACLPENLRLG